MAEARVDLVLGNSQFLNGIAQADAAQKRFANSWEGSVGRIFKRSPFMRAERAISEFALNLGSGNIGGAFAALGSRITGLGLAAAVGIGVGIGFLQKLKAEAISASDATRKLGVDLATAGGTRSPDASRQKFQEVLGGTEDLLQKSDAPGNKLANFLDRFVNPLLGTSSKNRGGDQKSIINAGLKAAASLLDDQAEIEERISKIKEKGNTLDKVALDSAIKQNQLAEEMLKFKLSLFDPRLHDVLPPALRDQLITSANASTQSRQFSAARESTFDFVNAQRGIFNQSTKGFNPRTAALTEDFLREKIASDPNAPGVKQMQLQADQLQLFRRNARLGELKDLEQNNIAIGPGARAFQERNRQAIADQQQSVTDQTNRVFGEQSDVANNQGVIDAINIVVQKMDAYWK